MPQAWQMVLMDVAEAAFYPLHKKVKFLLIMDAATKFKVVVPLKEYRYKEQQHNESGEEVITPSSRFLADKPKPLVVVPDTANTLTSTAFREFCNSNNLWPSPPVEKEAWAHGLAERAVQEVKATKDRHPRPGLLSRSLPCCGRGYSHFPWAYGQNYQWTDEDVATHLQLQQDHPVSEFHRLLQGRRVAEDLARQVRAETSATFENLCTNHFGESLAQKTPSRSTSWPSR